MQILGLGIDILCMTRLKHLSEKRRNFLIRFSKKILSLPEHEDFQYIMNTEDIKYKLQFLGTRWAVKEAAYKALSSYYPKLSWHDLVLSKGSNGSPTLKLVHEPHAILSSQLLLHVSTSHDQDILIATVLATKHQ